MINFILNSNQIHWLHFIKIGIVFILIGSLILLLKEIIIVILASIFILIGLLMFYFAFNLWQRKNS